MAITEITIENKQNNVQRCRTAFEKQQHELYQANGDFENLDGPLCIDWANFYKNCRRLANTYYKGKNFKFLFQSSWMQIIFRQLKALDMRSLNGRNSAETFSGASPTYSQENSYMVVSRGSKGEFHWLEKMQKHFEVKVIERAQQGTRFECEKGVDVECALWIHERMEKTEKTLDSNRTLTIVSSDADFRPVVERAIRRGWKVVVWAFSDSISKCPNGYLEFLQSSENVHVAFLDKIFLHMGHMREVEFNYSLKAHEVDPSVTHLDVIEELVKQKFATEDFCIRWNGGRDMYVNFKEESQREQLERLIRSGQFSILDSNASFERCFFTYNDGLTRTMVKRGGKL
jgi:uncharacterized LabA/DUF88 family protein